MSVTTIQLASTIWGVPTANITSDAQALAMLKMAGLRDKSAIYAGQPAILGTYTLAEATHTAVATVAVGLTVGASFILTLTDAEGTIDLLDPNGPQIYEPQDFYAEMHFGGTVVPSSLVEKISLAIDVTGATGRLILPPSHFTKGAGTYTIIFRRRRGFGAPDPTLSGANWGTNQDPQFGGLLTLTVS